MPEIQARLKTVVFYGVFVAVFIVYALIVFGAMLDPTLSGHVMKTISEMTPLMLEELSIPGELAPAVLGGLIALSAPTRASIIQLVLILILSALTWALFLHLQVYVGQARAVQALGAVDIANNDIPTAQAVISSFASSVRNFGAITFAAVIGLRLNDRAARAQELAQVRDEATEKAKADAAALEEARAEQAAGAPDVATPSKRSEISTKPDNNNPGGEQGEGDG